MMHDVRMSLRIMKSEYQKNQRLENEVVLNINCRCPRCQGDGCPSPSSSLSYSSSYSADSSSRKTRSGSSTGSSSGSSVTVSRESVINMVRETEERHPREVRIADTKAHNQK